MANLWEHEEPVTSLDIDVPAWIDQDISPCDVAAIIQGGCASGAYMPAVTSYKANQTMTDHGDDVLQYIENQLGEIDNPNMNNMSWSGLACYFLSMAVELWAQSIESELETALEDKLCA